MKRLFVLLFVLAVPSAASARVVTSEGEGEAPDREPSLRSRLGVSGALALATSTDKLERVRGLERLGAAGTPRALYQLVRAVSPNGSAVTPEERLTAVRQLARFSSDPDARRALTFVLGGHLSPEVGDAPHPLDVLAEGTAALALARSATPDAATSLGKALSTSGSPGVHAANALLAYPPRDLDAVLKSVSIPTVTLASFLGDLGDQRALEFLRNLVRRAPLPVRAAAAVSLTRLGDYEALPLARKWSVPGEHPALRVAAATILVLARDGDAARAVTVLLGADETATAGLALSRELREASLAKAIAGHLDDPDFERAVAAVAALGECEGAEAVQALERALGDGRLGSRAAEALSRMRLAGAAIGRALEAPALRRNAARAATARLYVRGEEIPGFRRWVRVLASSPLPADRAVAAAAAGVLARDQIWPLLWSKDAGVSATAAALLLVAPPGVPEAIAAALPRGAPASGIALALPSARAAAPTAVLVALADSMEVATPMAIYALAARDDPRLRESTNAALQSPDAAIRLHAASGLGDSTERDAEGRLAARYRFETDARVRRAIMSSLSRRLRGGQGVLALAATLDPDVPTRVTARVALAGTRIREPFTGDTLVWLHPEPEPAPVTRRPPSVGGASVAGRAVALPSGLAVPVVPDPDGQLLVPGLPAGSIAVRVAPEGKADDASVGGKRGSEKSAPGSRAR